MKGYVERKRNGRWVSAAVIIIGVLFVTGCAQFRTERGVDSRWRAQDVPVFHVGTTKQADVLKFLGPPSQLISLNQGSVFYYLREQGKGAGLILLVYNEVQFKVGYDRAIFFFDAQGVLTDYAYSHERGPESADKAKAGSP